MEAQSSNRMAWIEVALEQYEKRLIRSLRIG